MRTITWLSLMIGGVLTACLPHAAVKNKLDVIEDTARCGKQASALVVFLPGRYDTPADFVEQGFVSAIRERKLDADVVVADAHMGYYRSGLILKRIHEDIILPAKEKGYQQIWLAGISLGGYGSLLYAKDHGELITGIVLMAPYLGDEDVFKEVTRAGGLAQWPAREIGPTDRDRAVWAWLKDYGRSSQARTVYPNLYIGYGTEDRFAPSNRLLAQVLSTSHVMTTEGGHAWTPWRRLWDAFLDQNMLPACSR